MNSSHAESLRQLIGSLDQYASLGVSSDGETPPEAIVKGHYVHDAVIGVESHYPAGKLPAPERVNWMDLLQVTRGSRQTARPNQEALQVVIVLSAWAEHELDEIAFGEGGYESTKSHVEA